MENRTKKAVEEIIKKNKIKFIKSLGIKDTKWHKITMVAKGNVDIYVDGKKTKKQKGLSFEEWIRLNKITL